MKKLIGLLRTQTLKDSFIIFIGLGVTAIFGLIYTIVLARAIGPVNFGIYSAITALATIIYSLGDLGISPAIIYLIPKQKLDRYILVATGFWMQFFVTVSAFIFIVIFALFLRFLIPGSTQTDLLLAGGITINYLLIGFAQGVFTAEKKFWSYSFSQIIDATVKIVIVFFLFKLNRLTVGSALTANFISTLFALFITFGKELFNIEFDFSRKIFVDIIKFAKWIAVSRIFNVLISKIDVILLNLMVGSFQAGIYAAAARVSLLFMLIVSGLGSVVNSRFSSFTSRHQVRAYLKKLIILTSGILLLMLLCAALAEPIVRLAYGEKYLDAISVFRYLTLAMIPFIFSVLTTPPLLYTYNQPKFYSMVSALQVIILVVLEILLIPSMGYFAPVLALGVSNILVLIISSIKLNSLINGNSLDHRQS